MTPSTPEPALSEVEGTPKTTCLDHRPQGADDYVYDALNRMTQKNYPDSTSVEYIYDLVGKGDGGRVGSWDHSLS
jgi:hypothetical protein